jgi:predicted RNA-binding Zn-ribbon protein involved in translation (DUF1610 family)
MAMVVECESCGSRFRLSVSLLKESKAVRFRCRRCGGSIMVRNPAAPAVIPVSAVSGKIAASPVTTDISSVVRPEIEQPTPHETPVPPPRRLGEAVPAPPCSPPAGHLETVCFRQESGFTIKYPPSQAVLAKHLLAGLSTLLLERSLFRNHGCRAGTAGKWFLHELAFCRTPPRDGPPSQEMSHRPESSRRQSVRS